MEKVILRNFTKSKCFPVNFSKFLRTSFFTEHLWATASVLNLSKVLNFLRVVIVNAKMKAVLLS